MTDFGYHASHEQFPPDDLLAYARLAGERGFTDALASDHFHPWSERQGEFGYEHVNVDDQRADPDSLLEWMVRAIGVRREHAAFGRGTVTLLETNPESVVSHRMDGERDVIAVHNLADEPRNVTLDVEDDLVSIFGDGRSGPVSTAPPGIDLRGYGYCWFRTGGMCP